MCYLLGRGIKNCICSFIKPNDKQDKKYSVEYASGLGAALAFGIIGLHMGWTGPTLVILMKETSPIPMTESQSSWLAGFLQIGAIPGPIIGSLLCDYFGRKKTIIFCGIPNIISYVLIICATNIPMLYAARFFCGLAVGIYFVAVPVYVGEISSPEIRGRLSFITTMFLSLFILIEYCIIPFVPIRVNAIIGLVFVFIQVIEFLFVPETPYFYIMKNKNNLTEKSLKTLRQSDDVYEEITELKTTWLKQQKSNATVWDILKTSVNRRCLLIVFIIIVAQQFSGFTAIIPYSQIIFEEVDDSPIPPTQSGIILTATNLIVTIISVRIIDSWGRRPLFLTSTIGAILPLVMVGVFFYLKDAGYKNISQYSFVPVIGFILYTVAFALSLPSLPYLICGEIFSTEHRATAGSILSIIGSIFGLIVTKLYQIISDSSGIYVSLWLFACFNAASALFGFFLIPETKGKSLDEIQKQLQSRANYK